MAERKSIECVVLKILILTVCVRVESFQCNRRPYSATTASSAADGRFALSIDGVDNTYVADQLYTVILAATDDESQFTSFMISAEGDQRADIRNPRKLITQFPGHIRPRDPETSKFSDRCLYSVEQTHKGLKHSVEAYWQAPPSGNGCVTFRAMVAESDELWYEDGNPLALRICEDTRQPDNAPPRINLECKICDEAKYELSFTGVWSRNTHPRNYPENEWEPKFSDLIGASHSTDFVLWAPGKYASLGLQTLAEYRNSSVIEMEIREKIGDTVRTLIKSKGHGYPKTRNPAYALFRADNKRHLVTTAVALHPSPDWFLGVSGFELCQDDNTWLKEKEVNLYPWDAGTNSAVSYESPRMETHPRDTVDRVEMGSYDKKSPFYETDIEDIHPFGLLKIRLVKTYRRECKIEDVKEENSAPEQTNTNETPKEPEQASRYQNQAMPREDNGREAPVTSIIETSAMCNLTDWEEWSQCEGVCVDGQITGYQMRQRYHLVDGYPIEKFDPEVKYPTTKTVSPYCKQQNDVFQERRCTVKCGDDAPEPLKPSRRIRIPINSGHPWNSKKQDANIKPLRN